MTTKIIDNEVFSFSAKFNIFFDFIESLKSSNERYLIYGYGKVAKTISDMNLDNVIGFVDKDASVVARANNDNIRIVSEIFSFKWDKIIVSVLARENEIKEYLQDVHGILPEDILVIPLSEEFYGDLYQKIYPNASYSPWLYNQEFLAIYNKIKNNTLVDILRCYEVYTLIQQVNKLKKGAMIEIGVFKGGTGAIIASQARRYSINEQVYLCDTFEGVVKSSSVDSCYTNGEHKVSEIVVKRLLNEMNLNNTVLLKGIFPEDTAGIIENEVFRFCHIDVDVYQSASDIMDWIWPRMVIGGIVLYDDFGFNTCEGITKQVEEQMNIDDRLVIYNINGHAIVIKLK